MDGMKTASRKVFEMYLICQKFFYVILVQYCGHYFSASDYNLIRMKLAVKDSLYQFGSGGSRGGSMGAMEPIFWRAAFENTMRKRTTYTTLTLELRTSASQ